MELLGDVGQVEPHFGLFGDSVSVSVILEHGLPRTYHRIRNHFGRTRWNYQMELLGDVGHVASRFGPFGDSVSVGARLVHSLRQKYHRLRIHFGCTR
jgi:hypothetical protein